MFKLNRFRDRLTIPRPRRPFAALHESDFGPKQTCRKTQSMSRLGVKRTGRFAAQMSAFDPERTFHLIFAVCSFFGRETVTETGRRMALSPAAPAISFFTHSASIFENIDMSSPFLLRKFSRRTRFFGFDPFGFFARPRKRTALPPRKPRV